MGKSAIGCLIFDSVHTESWPNYIFNSLVRYAYLGVEAGWARDEACNDQGEDHELEQPHEELPRVRDHVDVERVQLVEPKSQPQQNSWILDNCISGSDTFINNILTCHNAGESEDQ